MIQDKYRLNDLEQLIDLIEDNVATKINGGNYKKLNTYFDVVINSLAKSIMTMREIIVLSQNGYPDGALGLARNLFEQFIIISRFELEPACDRNCLAEKYCDDYNVKRYKFFRFMYDDLGMEKEKDKYENELNLIKNKYKSNNKSEYWWCGENSFYDVYKKIYNSSEEEYKHMLKSLHIYYKKACSELHASSFGNSNRIGEKNDAIYVGVLETGQEYALDFAVKSFIRVVMVSYRELKIDVDQVHEKLNDLAEFYQKLVNDSLFAMKKMLNDK